MRKDIYRRMMAIGLSVCLLPNVAGCGSSDDSSYDEEYVVEETEESTEEYMYEDQAEYAQGSENESENAESEAEEETEFDYDVEDLGVTFKLPIAYATTDGYIRFDCNDVTGTDGVFYGEMVYFGLHADELDAMFSKDEVSDEENQKFMDSMVPVFTIVAATENRSPKDVALYLKEYAGVEAEESDLTLLKTVDDSSFYDCTKLNLDNLKNLDESLKSEYESLASMKDEIYANSSYARPRTTAEKLVGSTVSFTTKDFDGNTVTSEEIFSNFEVTMINVWATWCGFCVGELEELEKIDKNLQAKNCAIVGMCGDATDEAKIKEAKEILEAYGVTYYNICPFDDWGETFEMSGWPSSFFVGKDGKMVAPAIYGAKVDKYEATIDDVLAGKTIAPVAATNSYSNASDSYVIYVVDETGAPIENAMVQFCTNDTCNMKTTGSDGTVSFSDPPGIYEVHILKLPDGYQGNQDVYRTEDHYSTMVIVAKKG